MFLSSLKHYINLCSQVKDRKGQLKNTVANLSNKEWSINTVYTKTFVISTYSLAIKMHVIIFYSIKE